MAASWYKLHIVDDFRGLFQNVAGSRLGFTVCYSDTVTVVRGCVVDDGRRRWGEHKATANSCTSLFLFCCSQSRQLESSCLSIERSLLLVFIREGVPILSQTEPKPVIKGQLCACLPLHTSISALFPPEPLSNTCNSGRLHPCV
jgi:hypothetical protein